MSMRTHSEIPTAIRAVLLLVCLLGATQAHAATYDEESSPVVAARPVATAVPAASTLLPAQPVSSATALVPRTQSNIDDSRPADFGIADVCALAVIGLLSLAFRANRRWHKRRRTRPAAWLALR